MMNHDLLAEVFHREIHKQEEAQERKKLVEKHDAGFQQLQEEMTALKLAHDNEKIRMRWEHADEVGGWGEDRGTGESEDRGGGGFIFTSDYFFSLSHAVVVVFCCKL